MIRSLVVHLLTLHVTLACGASNGPWDPYQAAGVLDLGLPPCCEPYAPHAPVLPVYADDPTHAQAWTPVVDPLGVPVEAGAPGDAYFTGRSPPETPLRPHPDYFYDRGREDDTLAVDLSRRYSEVDAVAFRPFSTDPHGRLSDVGRVAVRGWLRGWYGGRARIVELGEGGFSVAFRVCQAGGRCVVAKVRKIPPCHTPGQLRSQLHLALRDLRRDLAVAEVARAVIARGWLIDPRGRRERLARVARFTDRSLISRGVLEQELVVFAAGPSLRARLARLRDDAAWRARAIAESHAVRTVSEADARAFVRRFSEPSRFGPDVIKVRAWVAACEGLSALPILGGVCASARRDFRIPPDFMARLGALEQLYRDTAADVIRFSRVNVRDATGNRAVDGLIREVGLDYNHGRNAGWEPATGQFVLFDY